jgi:hypothetical protein
VGKNNNNEFKLNLYDTHPITPDPSLRDVSVTGDSRIHARRLILR